MFTNTTMWLRHARIYIRRHGIRGFIARIFSVWRTGNLNDYLKSLTRQRGDTQFAVDISTVGDGAHLPSVVETAPLHAVKTIRRLSSYIDQVQESSRPSNGIRLDYVGKSASPFDTTNAPIRLVAFYLPQFHPIPENDQWWGKGFTEWTNVSKAVPQFIGHYQPHLPGELGFYDLRLVDVMRQQAELARHYGLGGFCFHYYWFGGRRLLERPINQYIADSSIDFPFCFCWANENWTRRWDGQDNEVLMAQQHSPEDDIAFIDDVIEAFRDKRYIRIQGKPVLLVYRVSLLPNPKETAGRWRARCREKGIGEIYLVAARSFEITDPHPYGFDAAVEFPPHQIPAARINHLVDIINPDYLGSIYSYADLAKGYAKQEVSGYHLIKTVTPSWDNEARKPGAGHTFYGSGPLLYANWLRDSYTYAVEKVRQDPEAPDVLFVNAWNEWAEGAHLEPDRKYGYAFLHATANILLNNVKPHKEVEAVLHRSIEEFVKTSDVSLVCHVYYEETLDEILEYMSVTHDADAFFSVRKDISIKNIYKIVDRFPRARIEVFPNIGRDIYPFVKIGEFLSKSNYKYVCKIHSKRSPQRSDGDILRRRSFDALLGSSSRVDGVLTQFESDTSLGILAPSGAIISAAPVGRHILNRRWLDRLLPRLDRSDKIGNYDFEFVAGSMYWARVDALTPILSLGLKQTDFELEVGQYDGTLAHALERLISAAAASAGYATKEIART